MHNIHATSVSVALSEALHHLVRSGEREESRNGVVLVAPYPVVTTYYTPQNRVLFSPQRDANPFFHFFEALWMLSGRNDLEWPLFFNSKFGSFSDDGVLVHGAYGHRWRKHFKFDQLRLIAEELRTNPSSRRMVLQMWDCFKATDLGLAVTGGKDVPCNTHAYFDMRRDRLNMTVCCRSNDVFWGAYGANAVHFSMLLEVMAAWIGVPMGEYRHMSNNLHVYTDIFPEEKFLPLSWELDDTDHYARGLNATSMVNTSIESWLEDLNSFMSSPRATVQLMDPFFRKTAVPMYAAFDDWKRKSYDSALNNAERIEAEDWRIAATEWITRRRDRHAK